MRDPQVALVYLSDRRVAYSSLAFYLLKGLLEDLGVPHTVYFLEENRLIAETPSPSPARAKLWMISLPYELLYVDLVKTIISTGLNPWREKRRGPIILAGGPSITANPLPLFNIVDAFLIGEAEPVFEEIMNIISMTNSREKILQELSGIKGILVPKYNRKVRRIYAENLDATWYPVDQRSPRDVEPVWGRSFILETSRGCARMCRFCMEGTIFRPKRDRSYTRLRDLLVNGVATTSYKKVSFYSLAFFDSPHAEKILEYAVTNGLEVSVPSLRAETITRERAKLISMGGQKTITIAPETGSCRLGRAINKCIGTEGTLQAVEASIEAGIRNIKLYLIIGFPGERMNDIEETVKLVRKTIDLVARVGGTLKLSINPFIPKPVTPLQWAPAPNASYFKKLANMIAKEARIRGGKATFYDVKWAHTQTIIARAGIEFGEVLVRWAQYGGRLGSLRRAIKETGLDTSKYLSGWPIDHTPQWHNYIEHPYASLRGLRFEYETYLKEVELI